MIGDAPSNMLQWLRISANGKRRLACNEGSCHVRMLEIAFGDWQPDDVTRYEDDFDRSIQGE